MSLAKEAAKLAPTEDLIREAEKIHAAHYPEYQKAREELEQHHAKKISRATTAANFLANYGVGTVTKPVGMMVGGAVTAPALLLGPAGIPIVAKGIWTGRQVASKANAAITRPLIDMAVRKASGEAIHRAAMGQVYGAEHLRRLKELGLSANRAGFKNVELEMRPAAPVEMGL